MRSQPVQVVADRDEAFGEPGAAQGRDEAPSSAGYGPARTTPLPAEQRRPRSRARGSAHGEPSPPRTPTTPTGAWKRKERRPPRSTAARPSRRSAERLRPVRRRARAARRSTAAARPAAPRCAARAPPSASSVGERVDLVEQRLRGAPQVARSRGGGHARPQRLRSGHARGKLKRPGARSECRALASRRAHEQLGEPERQALVDHQRVHLGAAARGRSRRCRPAPPRRRSARTPRSPTGCAGS